jgi:hypothetical protein
LSVSSISSSGQNELRGREYPLKIKEQIDDHGETGPPSFDQDHKLSAAPHCNEGRIYTQGGPAAILF